MSVDLQGQPSSESCQTIDTATNLQVEYSVRHQIDLRGVNETVFNTNPSIVHSFRQTVATILEVQAPRVINIHAQSMNRRRHLSVRLVVAGHRVLGEQHQQCTVSFEIETSTAEEMKSLLDDFPTKMSSAAFTEELERNIRASRIDNVGSVTYGKVSADISMTPTAAGTRGRSSIASNTSSVTPSSSLASEGVSERTILAGLGVGMVACVLAVAWCVCFKIKKKPIVLSDRLDISIELDAAIEMESNPMPTEQERRTSREYYYDSDENEMS
jgi:hypothetical protein